MAALLPIVLLFAVMYLLVIRPQQRRVRQHQLFVDSLARGEEVVTAGGIFGTITGLEDQTVSLRIAPDVSIRVLRASVTRRMADDAGEADDGEAEDDAEAGDEAGGDIGEIDALDAELRALEQAPDAETPRGSQSSRAGAETPPMPSVAEAPTAEAPTGPAAGIGPVGLGPIEKPEGPGPGDARPDERR